VSFDDDVKRYKLPKFKKTNQNTVLISILLLKRTEDKKGEILTEGYGPKKGNWLLAVTLWLLSCHGKDTTLRTLSLFLKNLS